MQVVIQPREIQQQTNTQTGEIRLYLEFELTNPASIERVNITRKPPNIINLFRELTGKQVIVDLERRTMESDNGRKFTFWQIGNDSLPQLFKLQPISQSSKAA